VKVDELGGHSRAIVAGPLDGAERAVRRSR
jgi:hypothetical protein